MEIYEKFSTEENSKQPIVILHPFNVMTDDVKKANNYIRNRTGRNRSFIVTYFSIIQSSNILNASSY